MEGSSSALPLLSNFTKLQLSSPSSSSSSTIQNANVVLPKEGELPGKDLKRKRSSGSVVPNNNERPVPRRNEEEQHFAGISTELVLYDNPCNIKKKLKQSDLGHLSRLLLPRGCVEAHVLPLMDEEMKEKVKRGDGIKVVVRDADTREEHELVFRYWESSKSYVMNGDWNKLFVKGRGLEVGDEIGMFWDRVDRKFHFTVHRKVACGTSNAVR